MERKSTEKVHQSKSLDTDRKFWQLIRIQPVIMSLSSLHSSALVTVNRINERVVYDLKTISRPI